jgi:tetratricopeptide (TPR) repeat protein
VSRASRLFLALALTLAAVVGWPLAAAQAGPKLQATDVLYHSARFDLMNGKVDTALAKLEKAQRLAPAEPRLAMLRVQVLADTGRVPKALELSGRLLERDPRTYGRLYFLRAELLSRQGRAQEAEEALRAAEAVQTGKALRRQAEIFMQTKRYGRAAEVLARLERIEPGARQETLFLRAQALYLNRDYPGALALLDRAHDLDPASAAARSIERWRQEARRADRPWWLSASLGWMYDSNVFLDPVFEDPAHAVASGRSDQAWVAEAGGGARLQRVGPVELGLTFRGQNVEYFQETEASTTYLAPGFYLGGGHASFGWRVPYSFYYYFKGSTHQAYSRIHALNPYAYWQLSTNLRTYISGTLLERKYFDDRSGALHWGGATDLVWELDRPEDFLRLGARADVEDAYDDESGYRGYEATLAAGKGLTRSLSLTAELTWARYDFDRRPEWTLDFRDHDRQDQQWRFNFEARWRLPGWWRLSLAYYHLRNDSNVEPPEVSPYDYHKNVVSFTISKSF